MKRQIANFAFKQAFDSVIRIHLLNDNQFNSPTAFSMVQLMDVISAQWAYQNSLANVEASRNTLCELLTQK